MEIDDPYRELGVPADASDAEVKAAWRRLAARWHPDRNASQQALQKIQRINGALEAIRAAREQAMAEAPAQDPAAPAPAEPAGAAGAAGAAEAEQEAPGAVIEHAVSLTLEDAAGGCIVELQGEIPSPCGACAASGVAPEPAECTACAGRGQVQQTLWFPWLATASRCEACAGAGSAPAACPACDGTGHGAPRRYRSRVRIPAGVRDGQVLHARVRLQGGPARGQALDVRVSLRPHEWFTLADDGTVKVEVPVDGFAWVAERWVDVPTPHGLRQMRLQRGALTYRVRGGGFPPAASGVPADCLVTVVPLFPEQWTPAQQKLCDRLVASNTGNPSSPAGVRASAWAEQVAAWQSARPAPAG